MIRRHDSVRTAEQLRPTEVDIPQSRLKPNGKKDRFNRFLFYLFPLSKNHHRHSAPPSRRAMMADTLAVTPILINTRSHSGSRPSTSTSWDMPHHSSSTPDLPLDILIYNDPVIIRGTGIDYEPAIVRGVVKLSLHEDTDIKEVMIRCTGKAKLAVDATRSHHQTNILYLKEDDLLEGDKSHPHTLKAGRHEFPFAFELDASSAASLSANFGMSVIEYRLRALAVRPSFSTNYIASKTFTLVRSFTTEALEFQQTLEIENTWPDKIQYCVILPHKAWAAGDNVSAILKFTPLAKGVKVVSINMNLQEKVKTIYRAAAYEEIRIVCSKLQTFQDGRPTRQPSEAAPPSPNPSTESDALQMNRRRQSQPSGNHHGSSFFRRVGSRVHSRENTLSLGLFRGGNRTGEDSHACSGLSSTSASSPAEPSPSASAPPSAHASPPTSPGRSVSNSLTSDDNEGEDVEIIIRMRIPTDATPSHGIAPVFISHRIKWDVLISNLDGHHSELRCSLPIHLLAKDVLDESLVATHTTRTALLGESHGVLVQEVVLPAYHDHLRDRVAIDELYAHTLANNPLNAAATAAVAPLLTTPSDEGSEPALTLLSSSYGPTSTLPEQMRTSRVPRIASMPDASERGRIRGTSDINSAQSSELYLSLGRRPNTANSSTNHEHPASQSSSRASSPDRMGDTSSRSSRHAFGIKAFTTVFNKSKASIPSSSRPGSSHKHNNNSPSAWPGAGGPKFSLSRSSSGPSTPSSPELMPHTPFSRSHRSNSPPSAQTLSVQTSSQQTASTATSTSLCLGDYYDTVPDYSFAAQGFLGGGITPLSALRGLPSYDQAERSKHNSSTNSAGTTSQGGSVSHSSGGRRRSGSRSRRPSAERRASRERRPSSRPPLRRLSGDQQGV